MIRRIVLICSAGVSTNMLVRRMEHEAARLGYPCSVTFYPIQEVKEAAQFADVMLLAPQSAFELPEIQVKYPNVKSAVIPKDLYASIDSVKILDLAQKIAGDY
ncbi:MULTISPECIES: PTS lactose transporter subunit IIB [Selenomonas]|jgi:PTS system cellobiose-specific IIB component|uniref:PTS lactose transporter subunit IIB n=1 Tax=Selenomonas ruminantium TaxID=971 RepID=A0A1K1Q9I0_SELRU|nr:MULTISPECIES: PTS lactose transporter subunit IIB [Selenomonas]MBP3780712.1 PTS lactose transporter subunit IIB [Selenomonas sp.]MBE6085315.1 PTS lactose transporter subunit IIB [Selenomonas ruminantium]SEA25523.1 PTS system, cellobiose-specific IIB component [Selenomonas ruminantium]SFB04489.1 PTS system, cellobiose-specific IIB component [Selenomonas ruminantium]SFW56331.1 PTS system, cellobiose-specific IIB component [Selenomonas ruminantium]